MRRELIEAAVARIRELSGLRPRVCVVLGSGLGGVVDIVEDGERINYGEIEGFPRPQVEGHEGQLVMGRVGEVCVGVLQGRVHLYEGVTAEEVVLPVRTLIRLGAKFVVLTNAAGGINEGFEPGDLMCIDDQINLQGTNPLIGANEGGYGPRFPDMSCAYDKELREILDSAARAEGIELRHGVYAGVLGPAYETPAEVRMLRILGADAVGMSTVGEAIAARHMGARVCGISLITNKAAGVGKGELSHEEVKRVAAGAAGRCMRLLARAIAEMGKIV
ncbi:MAG: purine-nucleoside phosphorylase [bacterium]|nr:purine-nucleoside phosphorylase [bacterium]